MWGQISSIVFLLVGEFFNYYIKSFYRFEIIIHYNVHVSIKFRIYGGWVGG